MLAQGFEIAKTNWKHNLFSHFVLSVLFLVAAPVIMGVKNLEELQMARIVDFYLCFLGVLLFIPVFLPDANRDIRDLIASKKTPITAVRIVRLVQAFLAVSFLLLGFLIGLRIGNCHFSFGKFFYAALADCVAMGGLGLFFYSMSDQVVLAYMAPVIYYVASMGAGRKYLKGFWLMSLCGGGDVVSAKDKVYILAAGAILMVAAFLIKWKRRA